MFSRRRRLAMLVPALVAGPLILMSAPGNADAASGSSHKHGHALGLDGGPARDGGEDGQSIADLAAQYSAERSAPGATVSAAALLAARGQATALAASAGPLGRADVIVLQRGADRFHRPNMVQRRRR